MARFRPATAIIDYPRKVEQGIGQLEILFIGERDLFLEQATHCEGELVAKSRWNAELGPENIERHSPDRPDIDHVGLDLVLLQVDLEDDRGIVGQGLVTP